MLHLYGPALAPRLTNFSHQQYAQFANSMLNAGLSSRGPQAGQDTFSRENSFGSVQSRPGASSLRFGSRETDQRVEALLNHMPPDHQRELSRFFRVMMKSRQTPIGYTMFGDKPMSFIECDEVMQLRLIPAYQLWQRYARHLPSDNTMFRIMQDESDDPLPDIYIINKSAFLKTVHRNLDQFKAVLGDDITPQKLLDDIMADESPILRNKLNNSQRLYGLLFGLTPEDTEDADGFTAEAGSLPAHMIPVQHFDPQGNQNYRRVSLPFALNIHGRMPTSFSLLRHWKDQQPYLQQIADIPNDRDFLRVVMRKWADVSSCPELPIRK